MRILMVSACYEPAWDFGGPIEVMMEIAARLARRGHSVEVLASNLLNVNGDKIPEKDEFRAGGVPVTYLNSVWNYRHYAVTPGIFSFCERRIPQFDLVHLYGYRYFQVLITSWYARRLGVPYVMQSLGTLPRTQRSTIKKWVYDQTLGRGTLLHAACFIATTDWEKQQFERLRFRKPIEVVPNGIEPPADLARRPRGRFKNYLGINGQRLILFVGRITPIKGLDLLIRSVPLMKNRNSVVAIVGPDEAHQAELLALVRRLDIERRVIFPGPRYGDPKWDAYLDADLFVLPSYQDNFPHVVLEAAACGCPVIVSEGCGIRDLVAEYKIGAVSPLESGELAHRIDLLLADPNVREETSRNCARLLRERGSWEHTVDRLEELYAGATGNGGRS